MPPALLLCSLRGFVCEDTITDPQGLLEIACGNKVETLKGIKGIPEISWLGEVALEIMFSGPISPLE